MSMESAREFIKKMNTDESFAKKISNAGNDENSHVIIAKQEGFDFTANELKDAGDLLNDEQLNQVAAGQEGLTFGLAQSVNVNGKAFVNHPINALD